MQTIVETQTTCAFDLGQVANDQEIAHAAGSIGKVGRQVDKWHPVFDHGDRAISQVVSIQPPKFDLAQVRSDGSLLTMHLQELHDFDEEFNPCRYSKAALSLLDSYCRRPDALP
jgi:hypothetical protein